MHREFALVSVMQKRATNPRSLFVGVGKRKSTKDKLPTEKVISRGFWTRVRFPSSPPIRKRHPCGASFLLVEMTLIDPNLMPASNSGSHTPTEGRQACLPDAGRRYTRQRRDTRHSTRQKQDIRHAIFKPHDASLRCLFLICGDDPHCTRRLPAIEQTSYKKQGIVYGFIRLMK